MLQHKINTKKQRPGLVASYNIRPGNGEGLFLFWHVINLSLTDLLRSCQPTAVLESGSVNRRLKLTERGATAPLSRGSMLK